MAILKKLMKCTKGWKTQFKNNLWNEGINKFVCIICNAHLWNVSNQNWVMFVIIGYWVHIYIYIYSCWNNVFWKYMQQMPPRWKHVSVDFYRSQCDNFFRLIKYCCIQFKCIWDFEQKWNNKLDHIFKNTSSSTSFKCF
jgi:hypothetical protein